MGVKIGHSLEQIKGETNWLKQNLYQKLLVLRAETSNLIDDDDVLLGLGAVWTGW
jgi:hypothetical protein